MAVSNWHMRLMLLTAAWLPACGTLGTGTPAFLMDTNAPVEVFIAHNFKSATDAGEEAKIQHGVFYPAPITGLNTTYLSKPHKDLTTFCSAQGGSFIKVAEPDGGLGRRVGGELAALGRTTSPLEAGMRAKAEAHRRGQTEHEATEIAGAVHAEQAKANRERAPQRSTAQNERLMLTGALADAARNGLLGGYECRVEERWRFSVTIDPVRHRVGNPDHNLLDVSRLYLRIRGTQALARKADGEML